MNSKRAKSIFLHAVEHVSPGEWPSYIEEACGDDTSLRNGVGLLLAAHRENVDLADQARQACNIAFPTLDQHKNEKQCLHSQFNTRNKFIKLLRRCYV